MKLRGGHDIVLSGRPSADIEPLKLPEQLHLPLRSRRFSFTEVFVENGQEVVAGEIIAVDPDNHAVPLLAPRGGTVDLDSAEGHITLSDLDHSKPEEDDQPADTQEERCEKLLQMGAWQFFSEARTGRLPDPEVFPEAVIISTLALEPFLARGDVQLLDDEEGFARGLEQVQTLLEYQRIYLIIPETLALTARRIRDRVRSHAWIKIVRVPAHYPYDNPAVLARHLELVDNPERPVWALKVEGVLAVERALTENLPCTERVISLGGPDIQQPAHLNTLPGYPISDILDGKLTSFPARVLEGGALTGRAVDDDTLGIDSECTGLTVLPEHLGREFMGFMRPGGDRQSYSICFLSHLRRLFGRTRRERITTAVWGELRACVSCGSCEDVCPAGIMPHLLHKYLYQDQLEEAESAGIELCVECGLCSYVCPSRIPLMQQFITGKEDIQSELHAEESAS